jgi:hypothetical protein
MNIRKTQSQPSFKALVIKGDIGEKALAKMQNAARNYRYSLEKGLLHSDEMVYCVKTTDDKTEKSLKKEFKNIIRETGISVETSPARSFLRKLFIKEAKVQTRPLSQINRLIANYYNKNPKEAAKKAYTNASIQYGYLLSLKKPHRQNIIVL